MRCVLAGVALGSVIARATDSLVCCLPPAEGFAELEVFDLPPLCSIVQFCDAGVDVAMTLALSSICRETRSDLRHAADV